MLRIVLVLVVAYAGLCAVLFLARHRFIFPIRGGGLGEPGRYGLQLGEVVEILSDGDTLRGWLLPATPAKDGKAPVLVWFHGNGETVAGLATLLRAFQPEGVTLLAVDYRGYGASTGSPTTANTEQDALALYDWIARQPELDSARVVVYGRSVGSGPAAFLAARRPVAGLILESPFTSIGAMARVGFPFAPSFLAGRAFDNLKRVDELRCPVLLIHGDRDVTIPTAMSWTLFERLKARDVPVELWTIPIATHNETYDVGGDEYVRRVKEFVARF